MTTKRCRHKFVFIKATTALTVVKVTERCEKCGKPRVRVER